MGCVYFETPFIYEDRWKSPKSEPDFYIIVRLLHFYWDLPAHKFRQVGCLFGFYGISTFVGYLMPNPFLCK